MSHIAILHGWSDTHSSFINLAKFLNDEGFQTVHLTDYISMKDDVRIEDIAIRMQAVITEMLTQGTLVAPFDLIVHSTGGLVAREWITRFYPKGTDCPVKRVVMLAPANFGSALASTGKSMLGRVLKGFDNWFEVGSRILDELELASAYQWDLAFRDLLAPDGPATGPYGPGKILPFVIVGTRGYTEELRQIVNEDGSDGTVRCAAANMNVVGLTLDFSRDDGIPQVYHWDQRCDVAIPFAILPDRNHTTICDPMAAPGLADVPDQLGALILQALTCNDAAYATIATEWDQVTSATHELVTNNTASAILLDGKDTDSLHQYFQVVIAVVDNHGRPVPDYFVEFYCPETGARGKIAEMVIFHREVIDDVHVNKLDSSRRCFFIDRTDLFEKYYGSQLRVRSLAASLSAANLGPNVRYFAQEAKGAKGDIKIHAKDEQTREGLPGRLHRNRTHLVKIIIPRRPAPGVFKLVGTPSPGPAV